MPSWPAIALVLGTAAPILVLEILAGGALAIATVPIVQALGGAASIGGTLVLTDDFAPVDQLLTGAS